MKRRTSLPVEMSALMLIALAVAALVLPACQRQDPPMDRSLNNLKQLAIGVASYSQDYGGTFPGWVRNPDGHYAHNVWDEQISPGIKSKDVYRGNDVDTGIKSWSDPQQQRVLTYGMNALLFAPSKRFDGHAPMESVNAKRPPEPLTTSSIPDPANTISFAELSTEQPMPGVYGQAPDPIPLVGPAPAGSARPKPSREWQSAHDGWIDVIPREFVETSGPVDSYDAAKWDASRGVTRAKYGGGGSYAFVDGHVKFQKIGQTVGLGQTVSPVKGKTYTVAAGDGTIWRADNPFNQWNP